MTATFKSARLKALGLPAGLAGIAALALVAATGGAVTAVARPSPDRTAAQAQDALAKGQVDKAIELAEKVVAAAPREAAYRALLGSAYLRAGRFESAGQAFDDALALGDNSARTALSLALAQIGAGQTADAVSILDDWRDAIPTADLGLALALAGESARGVAVLSDALRAGDNTPKLRQNLAYAYALDGRWREARIMAALDLPADRINDRIGEWAARSRPQDARSRVAALLAVPVRSDAGQPAALALADVPGGEQAAAEQGTLASLPPVAAPAPKVAAGELPAVNAPPAPMVDVAQYRPVQPVAAPPKIEAPRPVPVVAPVAKMTMIARPVVQPLPVRAAAPLPAPRVAAAPLRLAPAKAPAKPAPRTVLAAPVKPAVAAKPAARAGGSHLVQLGAFSSEQGARRAWGVLAARSPQLKGYRMTITPATVRGKQYWRVAAAGLDAGGASGLCANVKARGGACFAYAALPVRAAGPQLAVRGAATGPAKARR